MVARNYPINRATDLCACAIGPLTFSQLKVASCTENERKFFYQTKRLNHHQRETISSSFLSEFFSANFDDDDDCYLANIILAR